MPQHLATINYPDGSEITGEHVYSTLDGWIGIRLPGEDRIDEYPAETVSTWEAL